MDFSIDIEVSIVVCSCSDGTGLVRACLFFREINFTKKFREIDDKNSGPRVSIPDPIFSSF